MESRANTTSRLRRWLTGACAGALVALAPVVVADSIGVTAGAYAWHPDYSGHVRSGSEDVSVKHDLGLSSDTGNVVFIAIEHPIPLLPDVLVQHTQLDTGADATLSRSFSFDGTPYSAGDRVHSDLDLSHTDATLYYHLLDNWLQFNLGLTLRHFDNRVKIRSETSGAQASIDLNATIPMLYAAARFNLPLTGLYIAVDGNGVGYGGDTLLDYRALLGYESQIGLGAEIGMRNFGLNYHDGNDKADIKVNGGYASVYYRF